MANRQYMHITIRTWALFIVSSQKKHFQIQTHNDVRAPFGHLTAPPHIVVGLGAAHKSPQIAVRRFGN